MINLTDVLDQEPPNAHLDLKAIEMMLEGGVPVDDDPVSVSNDSGRLTIHGKTLTFGGGKGRTLVRVLHEAYRSYEPKVRT
ncbi:hypothetical protein [Magnetococcus sp. PR-3]|uniref:hypothetical protein n=1 Tax=Magnetococcus sp. PR-3 TaxID=3120355 RepID=UPI002FCE24E1